MMTARCEAVDGFIRQFKDDLKNPLLCGDKR